jgi:hypothetical protein
VADAEVIGLLLESFFWAVPLPRPLDLAIAAFSVFSRFSAADRGILLLLTLSSSVFWSRRFATGWEYEETSDRCCFEGRTSSLAEDIVHWVGSHDSRAQPGQGYRVNRGCDQDGCAWD